MAHPEDAQQQEAPPEDAAPYDDKACIGACNALWRKRGTGIAREGEPYLCQRCVSTLRAELSGLDTLAGMLAASEDGYRSSTGSDAAIRAHRNASNAGSPSPASDLVNELEDLLRRWVAVKRPVASRLGMLARPVTESASWLIANLHMYTADKECAGPLYDDVRRWHSRLAKRAKAGPALISKPVPCPRCPKGSRTLVQERGSEHVKCIQCNRIMSIKDYEDLAADAAESAAAGKSEAAAAKGA